MKQAQSRLFRCTLPKAQISAGIATLLMLASSAAMRAQDLPSAPSPMTQGANQGSPAPASEAAPRDSRNSPGPDATQDGADDPASPAAAKSAAAGHNSGAPARAQREPLPPGENFSWSRFATSLAQTGARFALPHGSMGGGGANSMWGGSGSGMPGGMGGDAMGSMSGGASVGGFAGGMGGGGMGVAMRLGPGSLFDLGGGLLHSLAMSSGGELGSSLNTLSHIVDLPRMGLSLPVGGISSSFSSGLFDSTGAGGGGGGFGSDGAGMAGGGGAGGLGAGMGSGGGMGGGPRGGRGGGGVTPALSLRLKF